MALAGFAAFSLARRAGWWLVVAAVLLWVVAGLGVAKQAGLARALTALAGLDELLSWLVRGAAVRPVQPGTVRASAGPAATTGSAGVSESTRRAVGEAAFHEINGLVGIEEAQRRIENLLALGRTAHERGQAGFGTGRVGVVVVLSGPSGTGKTTVAHALPRLLYGYGVLARPDLREMFAHDVAGHPAMASQASEALAAQSVGGALLIDDADWLCAPAANGVTRAGREVGRGILRAAQASPGAITVIVAGGAAFARALLEDHEQAAWLDKLHCVSIEFEHLPEPLMLELFEAALRRENTMLSGAARESAAAAIRVEMRAKADRFSNAIAMQSLAGRAIEMASRRSVVGDGAGKLIVEAQDIRALTTA